MANGSRQSNQLTFNWAPVKSEPLLTSVGPTEALAQGTLTGIDQPERSRSSRKSPAPLPVPKPLPSAVGKGNFGEDEKGPVRPRPDEVRAITEYHAEQLIELLDQLQVAEAKLRRGGTDDRVAVIREKDRLVSAYQSGLALYAEDFRKQAANRLDAYVRHQVGKE